MNNMNVVSVKFKNDGKVYYFNSEIELKHKDYVLVETEKGIQFGIIEHESISNDKIKKIQNLKNVIKKANKKDYNIYLKNLKDADIVLSDLKRKVIEDNIIMNIIDASYTFDRSQLIVNFLADERVDFRELVKYLAAKYKTHIELHQVGVRDKAKEIGGIGPCGMVLCCKRFKSNMDGISINMAKNQNLSLNPSKINGCCGRLLCCLSYENETYKECKKKYPKINEVIKIDDQECKVLKVDILRSKITIDCNGTIKEVDYNVK